MRNLTTLRVESASVDQDIKKFFSCDAESRIYVISEDNILHVWNLTTNKEEDSIPLEGDDLLENNSVITGCQYIPDLEATCICTKGGDILLYEDSETEIVGSFSAGIVCMSWSPDYELVIFVTQNKTLVQMTKNWDIVTEVTIPGFEDEQSNSNLNSDFTASLSWRGDGKVFACLVSSQSEITEQTQPGNTSVNTVRLHVFDRACVHESSSEQGVKIEPGNLSWRPSGSVITCTQRLPHRYDTIFFERNGLRHGEFTFRDECTVQQLEWNSASDLLSILVVKKDPNTNEDVSAIQIWYMNNWHWYLKQEFLFGAVNSGDDVIAFHWDEEDPLKLICICKAGEVRQFIFHWDTNVSEGLDKQNQSTVAVIDGDQLLLTPLRRLVPPPPMAATTLSTSASIRQVFYAPKTYDFFVVHSNATIEAFKSMQLPQFNPAIKKHGIKGFIGQGEPPIFDQKPESLGQFTTNGDLDISKCYQWICVDSYTFMALYCDLDDLTQLSKYKLILVNYSCSDKSLTKDAEIEIPGVPLRLYNNPDTGSIFLSLTNNEILRFSFPDELTNFTTLPTACATIQSVCFGPKKAKILESLDDLEAFEDEEEQATGDAPEGEVIIALNNRSRLYVNNEEVSRECNSFAVHDRYILFSTLTHKLRFIDHSFPYSKELLETTPQHMYDVCNREVERGSRIVAVVPYDTKVVLQMPRGNLETIYPRALLLSYCRSLLNNLDYRTAFLQMRNHRIDLNLLHDHNPSQFLENVEMFINALDSPTFLNLFLSSLIDDDVTVTLFPKREQNISSLVLPPYLVRESKKEGKVNRICTAVRSALETLDTNRYLLSILTTLVKQNPPHFGEALEIIRKLRNNERTAAAANDSAPTPADKKQITAESALDYMVFLVDVNHLYDVALSLYDFELTIMVASKSQKDPKEYLPFLKDLHALSPKEYQYYTIDMHLKNYRKALKNISKLDGDEFFEKAIQLIKQENLYALGIHLYYENEKRRFEIQKLYGEYLFQNSNYEESAIVFQQCKEWEKAFNSYLRTSEWQMVFALAEQLNYTPEQMVELANKVSTTYRNMGRFEEAGRILVEYANDPAEAIQCLTQGTEWKSALRLCHKYHMEHEISNLIDPAVQESHVIFMEMVESKLESYQKQFERLKVVKRSKILMPQIVNLPTDANLGDMFSETSSFASSRSSFSYVSVSEGGTKNRRRKKKKRISGKEGSLYEEEYLVEALKKLIPTANEQREVNELLKVLLLLGHNEEAEQLQNLYSKLNTLVESSLEVLIAPLIPMPGHEEELEEDERIREKIETKERLDRLYKSTPWNLSCIAKVD